MNVRILIAIGIVLNLNSLLLGQALYIPNTKVNGVNFIGPPSPSLDIDMISAVQVIHANWISFVPTAIVDRSSLTFLPDSTHNKWSETKAGVKAGIKLAKQAGLKIMIKPHLFLELLSEMNPYRVDKTTAAVWRGDFVAQSEADWKTFENEYRRYIMDLIHVANEYQVDMFCIGTELREFVQRRPVFWSTLIREIRRLYSGKLTYSANWDEYDIVPFWKDLDYIGIDAYFPVSNDRTPVESKAINKWLTIKFSLETFSKFHDKAILFTEYGYRNVDFAGKEPWTHNKGMDTPNTAAQVNLYRAFYRTFWDEEWVAGGFLWTWNYKATDIHSTDFNINNKAVLSVVRDWYK